MPAQKAMTAEYLSILEKPAGNRDRQVFSFNISFGIKPLYIASLGRLR